MKISKEIIKEAINFYEINDETYIEKCFKCLEEINNKELKRKIELIYNILYFGNDEKLFELWKTQDNSFLFGKEFHPFITNIIILLGYKEHIDNINKINLDKKQVLIHKKRIKECLENDILIKKYDGIRNSQMIWASHFIRCNIIEIGILQFEYKTVNPITDDKEECIKIHIPTGNKLDINKVEKSIKESNKLIKKYFRLDNPNYYCKSWLLSKEVRNVLNEKSNIYQFGNMFNINVGQECTKQILNFVFKDIQCTDYTKLEESTSLQRNLKRLLLNGKQIYIGIGKLKEEFKWTN